MVVLAGAICTKNGKALISRQFVDLSKVRIEGLLAAFPKLMGTGKQHTFIDTESIRYIYQPLESLYILLLTNKSSNILEDLETLHLLAKVVPEYCHQLEENEITKNAFELVFAFDEVIAMGYKERVTLPQIRHFTTMESHDEERAKIEEARKHAEAQKRAKEKMKELSEKKREDSKYGGMGGGSMGGGMGGGSVSHSPVVESSRQPYIEEKRAPPAPKDSKPIKGMSLGSKTKKSDIAKVLREEKIVEREEEADALVDAPSSTMPSGPATPTENVHVVVEEQLIIHVENDGGLQSMEIKGGLSVTCFDAALSRVKVAVKMGDNKSFQTRTHPLVDKAAFNNGELKLKEGARAFPTAAPAGILRWNTQTKDEAMLPLSINCWPSSGADGQSIINMEYELLAPFELHNVTIGVPLPSGGAPVVTSVDGMYEVNAREKVLYWKHPIIDQGNKSGSMEFSTPRADPSSFFPLQVKFTASKTFFDVEVEEVFAEETNKPVKYSQVTQLTVEQFDIV